MTAILSVVAVVQIGFLIRADKNARDALIADQRAFVFADSLRTEWKKQPDGTFTWILRPIWKNTGKTPTRKFRTATWGEIRDRQISLDISPSRSEGVPAFGLIGPGSVGFGPSWPVGNQVTQKDAVEVIAGRRWLYLWGYAKYYDVFSDRDEHTTHFCWLIAPTGDPMRVPKGMPCPSLIWSWTQHAKGNHADEDET